MSTGAAARVSGILTGLGRQVSEDVIAGELAELEGLDEGEATTMLLAAYGVDAQGRATTGFVPDRSSLESLLAVGRQGPTAIGYVLVAALLGLVPALAVPLLIRLFVDRYLVDADTQWVLPVVIGLLGAAFTASVLVALQYATLRMFALRLSRIGQVGFTWHVLGMRIPAIGDIGPGTLVARSNARQRLSYQGGVMLPMAAVNVINAIAFTIALLALDPVMCGAAILVCAVTAAASLLILRWRNPLQIRADDEFAALSGTTADLVGAIESIKAAGWEQFAFARWARVRSSAARSVTDLGVANQWLALLPAVALALGLGLVLGVGCLQVINGVLSIGSLVASQAFVAMLLESFGMLVFMGVLIQSVVSAARQADAVMRQPLDPEFIDLLPDDGQQVLAGELRLRGVTFGYDRAAPALVKGLDLTIPAGARVALVGRSGSGKTTIARLVTGELRPWSGVIELDGTPRLLVPRGVRTRGVAYVPQQAVLFPGTIRDNLCMWDDTVSEDDLRQAAIDARIEDTILARPGGYYATVSSQDSGFSGGEMQRLSIARALVRNPAILILDEATSALDPVVEEQVETNLRRRGCTCLIVAHRISTVRDADVILVIDGGNVVQQGAFEDIRAHGFFAELVHG